MRSNAVLLPSSFKRLAMTLLLTAVMIVVSACGTETNPGGAGTDQEKAADGKLKVTTTIGMITDIARNVGGEHVEVTGLMKSGVDPHLYQASQGDIRKLEGADIIFYNGLYLEGKMNDIFEKMAEKKPTIAVTRNIPESELLASDDEAYAHDPHVWFDVKLWMKAAETVREELVKHDPANKEAYEANAAAYLQQLEELDAYAREQIALIPEQQRVLVTAHDAFGYFGRAYNIEVMGLQGMSTASEYGSKDVSDLRNYLVEKGIKAVFVESSVPTKSIEAVIQGAKQQGHEVSIGGELFSDAMGKDGTAEGTYVGMVRHNVDTIVAALK